ncbi:MAG: ATP-binding protein [Pseudomonadota bacterium]|nr:ATP-binding protein [Pseudomonadota bacterium]
MTFQVSPWLTQRLSRKFMLAMSVCLLTISLIFLILFIQIYHKQLAQERSAASASVNRLLQASLENAMLKQDLNGLRNIINRLGQQEGIRNAFIINPKREIRFASNPEWLGHYLAPPLESQLTDYTDFSKPFTQFIVDEQGDEVLRSVNPVHNKSACTRCHGAIEANPINGILFVDYDAGTIRERAIQSGVFLIMAGGLVVILAILTVGWFMHRFVLVPVQDLMQASLALANGALDTRVKISSQDELGVLGNVFNQMATNLQDSLRKIKEQKMFLQSLIDAIPDGIRVINKNYHIITANQAYYQQLGCSQPAEASCYASSYSRQKPCPPTLMTCPLYEINKTGQTLKTLTEHVRADGSRLPVEVCAAPMHVEFNGQQQTLIVESVRDLTQTIQFSHEQKLSSVGRLAAGVAHEIYNPLSSIRLALQSTLRLLEYPQPEFSSINDYLKLVDTQIDECIHVTQRLLKLSAPSGEHRQLVTINEVVKETVALLAFEGQEYGVTMHTTFDDNLQYRVLAIESDIRMLVLNLLQNAFHAMPEGGNVNIHLFKCNQNIILNIQDTGVGVQPQIMDNIFDPFFSHRADGKRGSGLGLAICKSIVERYQGQIEVRNNNPHGCQFSITLPNAECQQQIAQVG